LGLLVSMLLRTLALTWSYKWNICHVADQAKSRARGTGKQGFKSPYSAG
jgi:hypothetical protein